MISVQNGLFLLNGKNYSYAMGVNAVGFLQHLYFGKKLQPADAEFLRYRGEKFFLSSPGDPNGDMATDGMPAELGSFGRGDFRSPTVRIARADGGAEGLCPVRESSFPVCPNTTDGSGISVKRRMKKSDYFRKG